MTFGSEACSFLFFSCCLHKDLLLGGETENGGLTCCLPHILTLRPGSWIQV